MTRYRKWYIGGKTGSGTRGVQINSVEICVEDIANANWFEWNGSQMIQVKEITVQCIDDERRFDSETNREQDKQSYTDQS